jgi:hypothetical protein
MSNRYFVITKIYATIVITTFVIGVWYSGVYLSGCVYGKIDQETCSNIRIFALAGFIFAMVFTPFMALFAYIEKQDMLEEERLLEEQRERDEQANNLEYPRFIL